MYFVRHRGYNQIKTPNMYYIEENLIYDVGVYFFHNFLVSISLT